MAGKSKILMSNIEYNRELATRVSEFQTMAAKRNSAIGESLENCVVKLFECSYSLRTATREDLLELIENKRIVDYILRIIKEEPLDKILKNVPLTKSGRIRLTSDLQKRIELRMAEEDIADGAYENAIRIYEEG